MSQNKMDCTDLNTEAHDAIRDLQDARSAIQRNEWRRAEEALAEALARIRRLEREIQGKLERPRYPLSTVRPQPRES
jgi:hypothetical protein